MNSLRLSDCHDQTKLDEIRLAQLKRNQLWTWLLRFLVGIGFLAFLFFMSWWFVDGRLSNPWLLLWLFLAVFYASAQMVGNWVLYLMACRPVNQPESPGEFSVDVYVTAYREPYVMIERTLTAACKMKGNHNTWLLDDGADPALAALAERLGAGYLTRRDHNNAKAGNVNAALPRTSGEIIAIFDVDHVPKPDFLEKSLGHFANPKIGFVQVMLTFGNAEESWVAQAATESSLEFYNPTYLGSDEIGGATMMGSNALIRREALESVGGYQPGLAEDLATSIALHAAGWQSSYVSEPLAPGQAPPSFVAWFIQQLKWARGVFELLLTDYPRLFSKLTWGQRLSYLVRMTKYWIGPAVGFHLFATVAVLIFASAAFRDAFHQYLILLTPLVVSDVLIRYVAIHTWKHPSSSKTTLTRAVSLVYATWPIYMIAWLMALLRLPLSFRPTPKGNGRLNPIWLLPQIAAILLLFVGMLYTVLIGGHRPSFLLIFAILQGALQLVLLTQWLYSEVRIGEGVPKYLTALRNHVQSVGLKRHEVDGRVRTYITNLPFSREPLPLDVVEVVINILNEARHKKRQVFVMGEPQDGLLAEIFASDLSKSAGKNGWPIFLVSQSKSDFESEHSSNTNQYYREQFIANLPGLIQPRDVFVGIFSNKIAPETMKAVKVAKEAKSQTIAFTGNIRSRIRNLVDVNLHVPGESSEQVEDGLRVIEHLICKALKEMDQENEIQDTSDFENDHIGSVLIANKLKEFVDERDYPDVIESRQATTILDQLRSFNLDLEAHDNQCEQIKEILTKTIGIFGAKSGSILFLDGTGAPCEAAISYENQVNLYPPDHLLDTVQRGLAGWVIEHRKPALVVDTRQDHRWLQRNWDKYTGSRSAISVPLMKGDQVAGILTLVHTTANQFNEGDLMLLAAISVNIPEQRISQINS
jgi:cellulose synthase (UDP-forming)